jgi:hypothetical protein
LRQRNTAVIGNQQNFMDRGGQHVKIPADCLNRPVKKSRVLDHRGSVHAALDRCHPERRRLIGTVIVSPVTCHLLQDLIHVPKTCRMIFNGCVDCIRRQPLPGDAVAL